MLPDASEAYRAVSLPKRVINYALVPAEPTYRMGSVKIRRNTAASFHYALKR